MARPVLDSTSEASSTSSTTVVFNSGTYSGAGTADALVAVVVRANDAATVPSSSAPSGDWELVHETIHTGSFDVSVGVSVYVLPAGVAKSGTYTFTLGSAVDYPSGGIAVVSGTNLTYTAGNEVDYGDEAGDVHVAGFGTGNADRLAIAAVARANGDNLTVNEGSWTNEQTIDGGYSAIYSYDAGTGAVANFDTGVNETYSWASSSVVFEELELAASSTALGSGYSKSGLSRPTDTWIKPTNSTIWWNEAQSRWDCILPVSDNDHWIVKDLGGTPSNAVELDTRATARPAIIWNDDTDTLYAFFPHDDNTRLYRVSYTSGTDTYAVDGGFPVEVGIHIDQQGAADTTNPNHSSPLGFVQTPNGDLWAACTARETEDVLDRRVEVTKSTNNGASWQTPRNLDNTVVEGATVMGWVNDGGTYKAVLVSAANNGGTGGFQAWSINEDDDVSDTWTTESLPALSGTEDSDDHLAVASYDGDMFVAYKTSSAGGSDCLIGLWKREGGGSWSDTTIWTGSDTATRPAVLVDRAANRLFVFAGQTSTDLELIAKWAPLSSLGDLASVDTFTVLDNGDDHDRGIILPRDSFDASVGLVGIVQPSGTDAFKVVEMAFNVGPPINPVGASVSVTAGTLTVTKVQVVTPTGASVTVTAGTLTVIEDQPITPTGATVTVTAGTLTVFEDQPITPTGASVTVTAGTLTVFEDQPITPTGASITVTAGTLTVAEDQPITATGASVSVTAGTVAISQGLTVSPTGASVSVTAGTLTVAPGEVDITPTGASVAVTAGTLEVDQAISVTGASVSVTAGSLSVDMAVALTGATVTVTAGTLTLAEDQAISLTGATIAVTAGSVSVVDAATLFTGTFVIASLARAYTVAAIERQYRIVAVDQAHVVEGISR